MTEIVCAQDLMNVSRPRWCAEACVSLSVSPPSPQSTYVCVWVYELKRVWRARRRDRQSEIAWRWEEKERGQTYSSLPWIHWLSHCRWRAFFMLHCYTALFTALFFMTLLPKDVGVLRRPLTVINITGCPLPTDIWVLLLHHYASASVLHRAGYGDSRTSRYSTRGGIAVSRIFKAPSGSFCIYFSFYSSCLLPLSLLLSLTASLRSCFPPPPSKALTHM